MINTGSLFSQLLQHFPRDRFATLVKTSDAESRAKGFSCWSQFVAMLFCQLAHADSLAVEDAAYIARGAGEGPTTNSRRPARVVYRSFRGGNNYA
jgi:hypothetical protein